MNTPLSRLLAVLYIRVSDEDQVRGFSLDAQERECREYCEREGYEVAAVFRDEARNAKSTAGRAQLQAAIDYVAASEGRVDALLCWNTDRFARNIMDHLSVRETLAAQGCRLLSVTENFDDSPSGRLFEHIKIALNQFDNEERARKTRTGMEQGAREGFWMHRTPLGYESYRDDAGRRRLRPCPDMGPLVAEAFRLVAGGAGKAEALRAVTDKGLRDHRGGNISPQRFSKLLANPVYAGWMQTSLTPEPVDGEWPALVDRDTWHIVNGICSGGAGKKHHTRRDEFPLKGFVRCPCGRPLTASWSKGKQGRKYPYYLCPKCRGQNIRKEKLEDEWCELLTSIALDDKPANLLKNILIEEFESIGEDQSLARDRWEKERSRLEARRKRLLQLLMDGTVGQDDYKRENAEIQTKLGEATSKARTAGETVQFSRAELDHALSILLEPAKFWRQSPYETRIAFQRLLFGEYIEWSKQDGVRTPLISRAVKDLRQLDGSTVEMAAPSCICWNSLVVVLRGICALSKAA